MINQETEQIDSRFTYLDLNIVLSEITWKKFILFNEVNNEQPSSPFKMFFCKKIK